ncbi:MAG: 23S rRNA (uracil(1939)-C(5))-methyltransferase RlmD, partial [Clostridia bacterium]|nr:23S rRNA (uracil(1939)-C(5))-methyltransferase RlmD [Clostridia bacterium]
TSKCAYGKLLEVIVPSEIRVRAECPVFGKCGGCQLQHIKYQNQLKIKEDTIVGCFKKIANLDVEVFPTVKGNHNFRYRNKLQLPVTFNGKETVIGFYAEGSHRVVPIEDCLINAVWTKNVILAFKKYINEFNIFGYNELDGSGELREITVKDVKGKIIITAVVLNKNLRGIDRLVEIIKQDVKYPFSLYLNVNTKNTNVIYGNEFYLVCGDPDYSSDMLGIRYRIGVQSFMQVNDSVCSKLYAQVRETVSADQNTTVIDAYSGAGLMTAILAKSAKKAIGVEIVKEAVELADKLAEQNGLSDKITNYCGKCEDILPQLIKIEKQENTNVCVVLDPPRKGCDIKVLDAILKSEIDKIVYVSCMPSTLARDVGLLIGSLEVVDGEIKRVENPKYRYSVEFIKPFDMFSQTKHVETLVCLHKI